MCCGFFVTKSGIALTIGHEKEKWVHPDGTVQAAMIQNKKAARNGPAEIPLTFKVGHSSSKADFTCLVLDAPVPAGTFTPFRISTSIDDDVVVGSQAIFLHGSIALSRHMNSKKPFPGVDVCTVNGAADELLVYSSSTFDGCCGGALLFKGEEIIGMHCEGFNNVPPDLEVLLSPRSETEAEAGAGDNPWRTKPEDAHSESLSELSPTTCALALRMDLPEIHAAIAELERGFLR